MKSFQYSSIVVFALKRESSLELFRRAKNAFDILFNIELV